MTTRRRSGGRPAARRCSSTTWRRPAPFCCTSCGSRAQLLPGSRRRAPRQGDRGCTPTAPRRAPAAPPRGRAAARAAPTAPISNSRVSTRSTTAWLSSTYRATSTPRVGLLEAREHRRQHVVAGSCGGADDHAAGHELAQVQDLGDGALLQVEDLAPVAVQHLARVCGRHGAPGAVQQRGLELPFHAAYLLAGGRLGDVQLVRRQREAVAVHDAAEQSELAQDPCAHLISPIGNMRPCRGAWRCRRCGRARLRRGAPARRRPCPAGSGPGAPAARCGAPAPGSRPRRAAGRAARPAGRRRPGASS